MLIRFITALSLINAFTSVCATEIGARLALELNENHETPNLSEAIVWKPISNKLSRFTLSLPDYGVQEAVRYQDTASLFYLSHVRDNGLSLVQEQTGTFEFILTPELSVTTYLHPLSRTLSLGLGAQFEDDKNMPIIVSEYRSVADHLSFQRHYLEISKSSLEVLMAHTELSIDERLENTWSLSLSSEQTRASFGRRWFEVIGKNSLLAEIGLTNEDIVFGWQLEHRFNLTTGFFGSLINPASKETAAFVGLRHNFENGSKVKIKSGSDLLSNSAQSLRRLRRDALPKSWKSYLKLGKN